METKQSVIFIYNNLGLFKSWVIPVAERLGFNFFNFAYPEDFEEWIAEDSSRINNIKLIVLGQYFPGDGSKQRKSGPSRGVIFYKELLEKIDTKKTQILIVAEIEDQKEYMKKCEEYSVTLQQHPIDILDFGNVYEKKLKQKTKQ